VILKARLSCTAAVLMTATLIACGGSDDPAPGASSDATPAAVPRAADSAAPQAGDPAAPPAASFRNPVLAQALPANFPTDVPVYAEADIAWSRASTDMAVVARFFSDDAPSDVSGFYADEFAAQGWATEIRETPDGTLIIADKLTRKAVVSVTEDDDGRTQMNLLITELPK
jgi:hypothetical protein